MTLAPRKVMTPDELRERMTGLAPDERPQIHGLVAFLCAVCLRVGYRRRRTA